MQTSALGIDALITEEGEVLKAYRCPAGVWTIGVGITSAAGVGKIGPGMVITRAQSRDLLRRALAHNYEPRVAKVMGQAAQHEFDAGVLFDFNTGAIHRASWVRSWRAKAERALIQQRFMLWVKGGGKVLPGLVKRRENEVRILLDGVYPELRPTRKPTATVAAWALPLSSMEKHEAIKGFRNLGYAVGDWYDAAARAGVERFQADHGLTVDGVIGRATLSTLQRRLDAAKKTVPVATVAALGPASIVTDTMDAVTGVPNADLAALAFGALVALWFTWTYRDVVATNVQHLAPRLSNFLRSF